MKKYIYLTGTFLILICVLVALKATAQPIERTGSSCPNGYHAQGAYCVPNSPKVPNVVVRKGSSCPNGYHAQGSYCVENEP